MGVPSGSTAKRTPMPKGQPCWVKVERVPTEDNSITVLETSAGNGLLMLLPNSTSTWLVVVVVGTDTKHLSGRNENLRDGYGFVLIIILGGGLKNWVVWMMMGLEREDLEEKWVEGRRRWVVVRWYWATCGIIWQFLKSIWVKFRLGLWRIQECNCNWVCREFRGFCELKKKKKVTG